jgi:beta-mannosidase
MRPARDDNPAGIDLAARAWRLSAAGETCNIPDHLRTTLEQGIEASLPGCVHADLLRAALIPDPRDGFNEEACAWIGLTSWEYRATFDGPAPQDPARRLDLVFDRLETVCEVWLNGVLLGAPACAFHPHRFDVRGHVRSGLNQLSVRFAPPLTHIRQTAARLGERPVNGDWDPFVFARGPAMNYGWDFSPKAPTCGITGGARLEVWSGVRIAHLRPLVERVQGNTWRVSACVDIERASDAISGPLSLRAAVRAPCGKEVAACEVSVEPAQSPASEGGNSLGTLAADLLLHDPPLWWPAGEGDQPLHTLVVEVASAHASQISRVCAAAARHFGVRETRLDTSPDARGRCFIFTINGRRIFCQGINFTPRELFKGAPARHGFDPLMLLDEHGRAGVNMLRIWGGGEYESDSFYDACDRLGIMVWHDFMFSCGMYPEEPPFPALVEAEARYQTARLAHHPSIVLWCGGNECVWGYEAWGWKERLKPGQTWGAAYAFELLPTVLAQIDGTRPYWPNSPWSGEQGAHPNDAARGDRHTWDVRLNGAATVLTRFCSEFGHQSPPSKEAMMASLGEEGYAEHTRAGGAALLAHLQRGPGGNRQQYAEIEEIFGDVSDFESWHFAASLLHARAVRTMFAWCRANAPACMGVLIWQHHDVWPGLTWAVVDDAGIPKPAFASMRGAMMPRTVDIFPQGDELVVGLSNMQPHALVEAGPWRPSITVERLSFGGKVLASERLSPPEIERGGGWLSGRLPPRVGQPDDPSRECLRAVSDDGISSPLWFYAPDRVLRLGVPRCEFLARQRAGGAEVMLRANSLVRDALPLWPRFGVRPLALARQVAANEPVTLLPGEVWSAWIEGDEAAAWVVRQAAPGGTLGENSLVCANRLDAQA